MANTPEEIAANKAEAWDKLTKWLATDCTHMFARNVLMKMVEFYQLEPLGASRGREATEPQPLCSWAHGGDGGSALREISAPSLAAGPALSEVLDSIKNTDGFPIIPHNICMILLDTLTPWLAQRDAAKDARDEQLRAINNANGHAAVALAERLKQAEAALREMTADLNDLACEVENNPNASQTVPSQLRALAVRPAEATT